MTESNTSVITESEVVLPTAVVEETKTEEIPAPKKARKPKKEKKTEVVVETPKPVEPELAAPIHHGLPLWKGHTICALIRGLQKLGAKPAAIRRVLKFLKIEVSGHTITTQYMHSRKGKKGAAFTAEQAEELKGLIVKAQTPVIDTGSSAS